MKTNPHDPATGFGLTQEGHVPGMTKRETMATQLLGALTIARPGMNSEYLVIEAVKRTDILIRKLNEEQK